MVTYAIPTEMSSVLTAPVEGDIELEIDRDDARFDTLNDGIEMATTFYSEAQGVADKVGLPFPGPRIQPTNAVELFVEPFSGDWNKIIACGDAVKKAGDGLRTVSENLLLGMGQLFAGSGGVWEGDAALAFQAHMGIHVGCYQGAGLVMEQGDVVFDAIAAFAREVAQLVVDLIDTALGLAEWLIRRIARYGRPWIGWLQLGYDLATDGWDAIQDIIDAMVTLYDTINAIFDLHDAVTAWVETIPEQLAVFGDLVGVMSEIPNLTETPLLTAAQIRSQVNDAGTTAAELAETRRQAEQDAQDAIDAMADLEDDVQAPAPSEDLGDIEVPEFDPDGS